MSKLRRLALFLVLAGAWFYFAWNFVRQHPWTWMQTLGLSLMIPAILLWFTAHQQLGLCLAC